MTSGNGEAFSTHTNTPGFKGVTGLPNISGLGFINDRLWDCTATESNDNEVYYMYYNKIELRTGVGLKHV